MSGPRNKDEETSFLSIQDAAFSLDELKEALGMTCEQMYTWIDEAQARGSDTKMVRSRSYTEQHISDCQSSPEDMRNEICRAFQMSVNPWSGRFWEKLYCRPDPYSIAAELVISATNTSAHVETASPYFTRIERFCVATFGSCFGYDPATCDGLTMPGGSASNTLALQTCLNARFPDFKQYGIIGALKEANRSIRSDKHGQPFGRLVVFIGEHAHFSIEQAAVASGLGKFSVVRVDCKSNGSLDASKLLEAVIQVSSPTSGPGTRGYPLFVCATAGTTVLGAFDPLNDIANICRDHGMWLHVDGSWGGSAIFAPTLAPLFHGIQRADSITVNPHKLLGVTQQCSFLLFKDLADAGPQADAPYLFHRRNKCYTDQAEKTFGCGRRPDAFKFYLAWKRHGSRGFAERIETTLQLSKRLWLWLQEASSDLQLELGPCSEPLFLQICFRPSISSSPHQTKAVLARECVLFAYDHINTKDFAVDYAPIPRTMEVYLRLVVHPYTAWTDLKELVYEVAKAGANFRAKHSL